MGAISDGRLDATGRASAGGIVVETCSLQSAEGLFNGHGRLALGDGDGPSLLAGEWSLPSLRALARPLDLLPSSLPALPVSGTANLSWVGPGPAIGTLSGDLRANLRTPGAGALMVTGTAGRWTLRYRQALAGETVAELHLATALHAADLQRSKLNGHVDVRSEDVVVLVQQLRALAIPLPASLDVVRAGRFTARGTVGGSIVEPVVDAFVSAAGVSAGRVDAIQAAGTVHVDRRQMVLKHVAIDAPGGHLELQGLIGFARAEGAGAFEARIDQLGRLAPMVPPDWRPTGSLAANGSWSGSLVQPRLSARLTGRELMANGLEFETLAGDAELVGDEVHVRDLRLAQRGGHLRVDGRYNIRARTLSTAVEGRGLRVALRRLRPATTDAAPVPDAEAENVSVDMRLDGSVLQPTGDVSLTADAMRLSGRDAGAIVAHARAEQGQVRFDLGGTALQCGRYWNHCGWSRRGRTR